MKGMSKASKAVFAAGIVVVAIGISGSVVWASDVPGAFQPQREQDRGVAAPPPRFPRDVSSRQGIVIHDPRRLLPPTRNSASENEVTDAPEKEVRDVPENEGTIVTAPPRLGPRR